MLEIDDNLYHIIKYLSIGIISSGFIISMYRIFVPKRFEKCVCYSSKCKTVVITGATSGIGKACAKELAQKNCRVILGCRNIKLANSVVQEIESRVPNSNIKFVHLDLTNLDSVKKFNDAIACEKVDVLINNAGVMAGHFRLIPGTHFEEDMMVNYLSQFYLTYLIMKSRLDDELNDPLRLVFVSSSLAKRGKLDLDKPDFSAVPYSVMQAYSNSKLAQCLFARYLQSMYPSKVRVVALFTGGMVHTGLSRNILLGYSRFFIRQFMYFVSWAFLQSPDQVCLSVVHAALGKDLNCSDTADCILRSQFKNLEWPTEIKVYDHLTKSLFTKTCDVLDINWKNDDL